MDSRNPFYGNRPPPAPTPTPPRPPTAPPDPWRGPVHQGTPRISFSAVEMLHLALGAGILTYAFAIVRGPDKFPDRLVPGQLLLLASFVAVTTGFVLHELAHKIVAQRYGHWAEFRAALVGLLMALVMSMFGLLVALPGATWIQGSVTRKESGVISLVGPSLNLVVAWIAFPFAISINPGDTVPTVFGLVAQVNSVLALFNLLPILLFGVALDGLKVWRWNKATWAITTALAVATLVYVNGVIMAFFPAPWH
ncbi:MAG: site-2 protease family protein [bacterium]